MEATPWRFESSQPHFSSLQCSLHSALIANLEALPRGLADVACDPLAVRTLSLPRSKPLLIAGPIPGITKFLNLLLELLVSKLPALPD